MVLVQALSYTALAVVAALVGGVVAIYRPPGPQMESNVQHFAAGVVTAAVAAELLPEIHERAPQVVVLGFAIGVVTMLGIHRLSKTIEKRDIGGQFAGAAGLLITVGIDMTIDGVLIGVTFLDNPDTGVIIAVALAIEVLFLGVAGVVALPDGIGTARKLAAARVGGDRRRGRAGRRDRRADRDHPRVRLRGPALPRHRGTTGEGREGPRDPDLDHAVFRRLPRDLPLGYAPLILITPTVYRRRRRRRWRSAGLAVVFSYAIADRETALGREWMGPRSR